MSTIQFKRDTKQKSNKLHLDKYYTPSEIVNHCISKTYEIIGRDNITEVIEPSAGNGAFSRNIENCIAYDIEPEAEGIIKQDFLELGCKYLKGRLIIGNPPYGSRLSMVKLFINKSFEIADYISFILPISQFNNNQIGYKFDLIYSEDLGEQSYSGIRVHCWLNIYKRPSVLNNERPYKKSNILTAKNFIAKRDLLKSDYDFAICAWGSAIGKKCEPNDYARTILVKIKDVKNFDYYKELILNADWCKLYPMPSSPNLLSWQIYKYVQDNKK